MNAYQTDSGISPEERERLIFEQMPLVRSIAERIHETLPGNACLDDLISAGVVGLIMAVDNYEPSRAVKLNTYAFYKIRGAIFDSLRSLDWASKMRRRKAREIERAIATAEKELQRKPTEEEIAQTLGVTLVEYRERLVDIQGLTIGSLNAEVSLGGESKQELITLVRDEGELPSTALERRELEKLVAQAISELPEREKLILALYYQEELTLREIGGMLNLHISRVAESKTTSIIRLRAQLSAKWPKRGTGR